MGRHAATDSTGVDPIIAAALLRRPPSGPAGAARHARPLTAADGDGGLGWPGEPGDGRGLGWPGDLSTPTDDAAQGTAAEQPPVRRRGWRRIFGGGGQDSRSSTAA